MNKRRIGLLLMVMFPVLLATQFAITHRRDDSAFGYISRRIGLAKDRNVFEVLKTMQVYATRERYDLAIAAGENWTTENPVSGFNDQVFLTISSTYLEHARRDNPNADIYVSKAIVYRDKALPTASDRAGGWYSIGAIHYMAMVSEEAGDLSEKQRCVQYRNALKLYRNAIERLNEKRDEISRRTPAEDEVGVSLAEADQRIRRTVSATKRLEAKVQGGTCE